MGDINLNILCSNGDMFSVRISLLKSQNCVAPANENKLIHRGMINFEG